MGSNGTGTGMKSVHLLSFIFVFCVDMIGSWRKLVFCTVEANILMRRYFYEPENLRDGSSDMSLFENSRRF
jgi:hypothetical protein